MVKRIEDNLPKTMEITGDKGITLQDVYEGKNTIEDFVAQLSVEELAQIVRGEGMSNPRVTQVQLQLLVEFQMHYLIMEFLQRVVQMDQVVLDMMEKLHSFQLVQFFQLHGMLR